MLDIFSTLFRYKEKESPDQLGYYPERVHVDAFPERRYLWTARLLVILACISICFNMMLACSIYVLLPMIKVKPRFYRINEYFNQIEMVQPREIKYHVSDLITEEYIKNYILQRYTISDDYEELMNRWDVGSTIFWHSTAGVFKDFQETEVNAALQQFRKYGLMRYVEVDWIKPLSRGSWQAEFKTYDFSTDNPEPSITYWRATLRIFYANISFPRKEDRQINPYGFLVANYSLSYHGSENEEESYIDTARRRSRRR